MNFNSKKTYLEARAKWKADYEQLSQDIRNARNAFNDAQRSFAAAAAKRNTVEKSSAWIEVQKARYLRQRLVAEAAQALDDLKAAKHTAHLQWQAHRRQPT